MTGSTSISIVPSLGSLSWLATTFRKPAFQAFERFRYGIAETHVGTVSIQNLNGGEVADTEIVDWVKIVRARRAPLGRPYPPHGCAQTASHPDCPCSRSLSRPICVGLAFIFLGGSPSIVCLSPYPAPQTFRRVPCHAFATTWSISLAQPKIHGRICDTC